LVQRHPDKQKMWRDGAGADSSSCHKLDSDLIGNLYYGAIP
jgi:hypothetical protein